MAFRATNVIPQLAYQQVRNLARNVKSNCAAFVSQMADSGANYTLLRDIYVFLKSADAQFDALAATPGLALHAQQQEDDETYDVVAEFVSMQATIDAVLGWMDANVPTSVTATAPNAWTQSGPLIATTFTPAQTAPLRTLLQSTADSIA